MNSLQDAQKRLECLKAAMGQTARAPSYEAVSRAFVGLQGSLSSGMSLLSYQAALQDVARELAIYKRDAPPAANAGVVKLQEALDTYGDAATFWRAEIGFYAYRDNAIAYGGGLPMKMVGLEWMLSKYNNMPTRKSDIWGINVGVLPDVGRQYLWSKARSDADEGLALLANPPKPMPMPGESIRSEPPPEDNTLFDAAAAKQAFASVFQKPEAVVFRGLFISTASGGSSKMLCGLVDAPNDAGVYQGFQRFYSNGKGYQGVEKKEQTFEAFWQQRCGNKIADVIDPLAVVP